METKIKFVSCHGIAERSFFYKKKKFPVCSRCTGIYVGYLTFPLFLFGLANPTFIFSILYIIPTIIDGLTQAFHEKESTNLLRFTTGIFSGVGISSIIHILGETTGIFILNTFL